MQKELGRPQLPIRPRNRRFLLQLLRMNGDLSRAELSELSGLSAPAVTNVTAELLTAGLVEELAPVRDLTAGRVGRPASRLVLASGGPVVLAVQIGAGLLQVGVCDLHGTVLAQSQTEFDLPDPEGRAVVRAIAMGRTLLRRKSLSRRVLLGVGIGAAGRIDESQSLVSRPGLEWSEMPVAAPFEAAFGVATVVDHNVRVMAMGESRYGDGRGLASLAFVYVRTGVGAGLILDGKAYRDRRNGAAEFGHTRAAPGGELCSCGAHGCLETVVSDSRLRQDMERLSLLPAAGASCAEALLQQVAAGDERALLVRDQLVEHLGTALVNLVNLLNPEVMVLGGLLHELGDILQEPLESMVAERAVPPSFGTRRIARSTFGRDAGVVGAATLALDHLVFGEVQLPVGHAS